MMEKRVFINGCRHYILNADCEKRVFFIDTRYFVEPDYDTKHPLGVVWKTRNCLDSQIRFIHQPNNSVLVFKKNEWELRKNPYRTIQIDTFAEDFMQLVGFLKRLICGKKGSSLVG